MTTAVRNWKEEVNGALVYQDLFEGGRVHYGPLITWGELSISSIGSRVTLVQGEIDLGYSSAQLGDLMSRLQGKRLSPLVAANMYNSIRLAIDFDRTHTINLSVLSSIPFPKIQLNASVMHSVNGYADFLEELKQGWRNRTLVSGDLVLEYEMVDAAVAYSVSLRYQEISRFLEGKFGRGLVPVDQMHDAVTQYVNGGVLNLARTMFPNGDRPREAEIRSYLIDRITSDLFMPGEVAVTFDSGEVLRGRRVREPGSLIKENLFNLIISSNSVEKIRIF